MTNMYFTQMTLTVILNQRNIGRIKMSAHKLFEQMLAANPTNDEISELYTDLCHVFDSPVDEKINEAIAMRGAVYIELPQPIAN